MQNLAQQIEAYKNSKTQTTSPSILTRLAERLREVEGAQPLTKQTEALVVGLLLDRTEQTYMELTQMDVPKEEAENHDTLAEAFALYFEAFEELLHSLEEPEPEPDDLLGILRDIDILDDFVASFLERENEAKIDACI